MKTYTFYRNGQEYKTSNLAEFCRVNHLQRARMNEMIDGYRESYKGFRLSDELNGPEIEGFKRIAKIIAGSLGKTYPDEYDPDKIAAFIREGLLQIPAELYDALEPDVKEELTKFNLAVRTE